ncbi:MAG TPA: prepilin peptidase [Spirochaetota bacterium]|nr:prepilin peptidase [Spirochaetota bacterium]HNT11456.1 prepilin peptidase [Spirochaetota bacterium]
MAHGAILWAVVFFLGAAWGSFFYTLALRWADGSFRESPWRALATPSRCPACASRIPLLRLIPALGFLIARGRCNSCGVRIPAAYPLAELGYGALAVVVALRLGVNAPGAVLFLVMGLAIAIAIIDAKTMEIPLPLTLAFVALSIYPIILTGSVRDTLLGFGIAAAFFVVMLLVFPGSFGGGDIKLAAAMGLLLGFELTIVMIETALVTGSVAGVIYAYRTKKGLRVRFPFAPFLAAGLVVALLFGRDIVLLYYRIMF